MFVIPYELQNWSWSNTFSPDRNPVPRPNQVSAPLWPCWSFTFSPLSLSRPSTHLPFIQPIAIKIYPKIVPRGVSHSSTMSYRCHPGVTLIAHGHFPKLYWFESNLPETGQNSRLEHRHSAYNAILCLSLVRSGLLCALQKVIHSWLITAANHEIPDVSHPKFP